MVETLNDETFDDAITNGMVMIDFWAEWCGPCKTLHPIMESLSEEVDGKVKIFKVNVDENPGLMAKFGIRGIPTVMLFKDGHLEETMVGVNTKEFYLDKI